MSVPLPESTPDVDRLTSLVFELASQLHVERAQRIALERALEESGTLPANWREQFEAGAGSDESYQSRCQEALDDAMDRLMQIMAESRDPRTPLRHEAAGFRDSQET